MESSTPSATSSRSVDANMKATSQGQTPSVQSADGRRTSTLLMFLCIGASILGLIQFLVGFEDHLGLLLPRNQSTFKPIQVNTNDQLSETFIINTRHTVPIVDENVKQAVDSYKYLKQSINLNQWMSPSSVSSSESAKRSTRNHDHRRKKRQYVRTPDSLSPKAISHHYTTTAQKKDTRNGDIAIPTERHHRDQKKIKDPLGQLRRVSNHVKGPPARRSTGKHHDRYRDQGNRRHNDRRHAKDKKERKKTA